MHHRGDRLIWFRTAHPAVLDPRREEPMFSIRSFTQRRRNRLVAAVATLATVATSLAVVAAAPASAAADPVYELRTGNAYANGLRVDVMWGSTAPYQGAFLWPDNASLSQEFTLLDSGSGYYRIQARHSGQCLMLDWRAGYTNGTKVIQYPYCAAGYAGGEWYTQWIYRKETCGTGFCFDTSSWYALIRNRATGKCLDLNNGAGGLPPQQAVLQQWDCITSPYQWNAWNQMFTFASPTSAGGPVVK
jgi:hypothetical protein